MSEQTPLQESSEQSKQALKNVRQQEKVKSTIIIGLTKIILAIAILSVGMWLSDNTNDLTSTEKIILSISSVFLAVFVLLIGNFRRLMKYFGDSIVEFKKVVWPTRQYALKMTGFVIAFVAILSIYIYGIDTLIWLFFNNLMK